MRINFLLLAAACTASLQVDAAILATETFGGDASGWIDRDPGEMSVTYDGSFGSLAGALRGTFATQALAFSETDAFRATNSSSSGSFVGDYANATGYTGFTFSFYAGTVLPSDLSVRFNGAGSTFFLNVLPQVVSAGQWYTVQAPLGFNAGWIGGNATSFSNALGSVGWIDVQITRSGTDQQSFWMDNFALTNEALLAVPEPGSGVLALAGFGLLMARRRIRKAVRTAMAPATVRRDAGFTLIELLVVIAILGILAALTVPVLGAARARGKSSACLSNVRQWGLALQASFSDAAGFYPWDGDDNVAANFSQAAWWANVLPPYVGQPRYVEVAAAGSVPVPPKQSIFVDGAATVPATALPGGYTAGSLKYFFTYVPNSALNTDIGGSGQKRIRETQIDQPSATIAMLEMRSVPDEIPSSDPNYAADLKRCKANWKRFSARHKNGGNVVFADGHAAYVTYAKTQIQNGGDYNQTDLIWNPLGPAK